MKVTPNKVDELNMQLVIEVEAADYADIERKKLAACRRKADFKGFRKGNVPPAMIKKVYGEQCLVESVNEVVYDALTGYIRDNGLKILGEPLFSESQKEQDWTDGASFCFTYDLGLNPELSFELEAGDELNQYEVTLDEEEKKSTVESMKKYYEENKKEGEESKSDEDIEKEACEYLNGRYREAAEWRLGRDIHDYFVKKSGVKLPEEFLKRWLIQTNEGKLSAEDVEKDFPGFVKDLEWQLVRNYLIEKFEFKVDKDYLHQLALDNVRYQYAMYGIKDMPNELLEDMAVNMLQDSKQLDRLAEQAQEKMVMDKIRSTVTLKPTAISSAEFNKLG